MYSIRVHIPDTSLIPDTYMQCDHPPTWTITDDVNNDVWTAVTASCATDEQEFTCLRRADVYCWRITDVSLTHHWNSPNPALIPQSWHISVCVTHICWHISTLTHPWCMFPVYRIASPVGFWDRPRGQPTPYPSKSQTSSRKIDKWFN